MASPPLEPLWVVASEAGEPTGILLLDASTPDSPRCRRGLYCHHTTTDASSYDNQRLASTAFNIQQNIGFCHHKKRKQEMHAEEKGDSVKGLTILG